MVLETNVVKVVGGSGGLRKWVLVHTLQKPDYLLSPRPDTPKPPYEVTPQADYTRAKIEAAEDEGPHDTCA